MKRRGNPDALNAWREFSKPYIEEHGFKEGLKLASDAYHDHREPEYVERHEHEMPHEENPSSVGGEALAVGLGVVGALVGLSVLAGVAQGIYQRKCQHTDWTRIIRGNGGNW